MVDPLYIAEISPKERRGMYGAFTILLFNIGNFVSLIATSDTPGFSMVGELLLL